MSTITLRLKNSPKVPLDLPTITPNHFAQKSLEEIENLWIWKGNKMVRIKEIFYVDGDVSSNPNDITIVLEGDLSKAKRIGTDMTTGSIIVKGNFGLYLGYRMRGGKIIVEGNVGSWAGVDMRGGEIEIKGNAGDLIGAALRGSSIGMRSGSILIHGNAGSEVGAWMAGGLIWIKGNVGLFPGVHMKDGTIVIEGNCDGRAGGNMKGGRVIVLGRINDILPSFHIDAIRQSVRVGDGKIAGPFYLFIGDLADDGNGKIFIKVESNKHLKKYETLMV
jgi:formylmethanofuran dehydrogenase subunit C